MIRAVFLAGICLASTPLAANDFFGSVETTTQDSAEPAGPVSTKMWLQQKIGYGYRDPAVGFGRTTADFTRAETRLYGQLKGKSQNWQWQMAGSINQDWLPDLQRAGLWSGYRLTEEQASARRWHWQTDDSYLAWQQGDWWIKGGYQTLAWGEAESLKVTDVLARRDQRWPGQEDLEQLRLPVPALLLAWRDRLEVVSLISARVDLHPEAFDEFDPLIRLRDSTTGAPEVHLHRRYRPGWAIRWRHTTPGLDSQVIAAEVNAFEPSFVGFPINHPLSLNLPPHDLLPDQVPVLDLPLAPPRVELVQDRHRILGFAIQSARGNWLVRSEQAWHKGVHLPSLDPLMAWPATDQWRAMYGLEYSGISDVTMTTEISTNYLLDNHQPLQDERWQTGYALRLRYTLFNERLTLGGLGLGIIGQQGEVFRLTADWQFSDDIIATLALVEYRASRTDQALFPYRHNDALILNLRWGL